jgi:hypothetical protein
VVRHRPTPARVPALEPQRHGLGSRRLTTAPRGWPGGITQLDLAAQHECIDVLARFLQSASHVGVHHMQMYPGLTVSATGAA